MNVLGLVVVPEVDKERDQFLADVTALSFRDGDLALVDLLDGQVSAAPRDVYPLERGEVTVPSGRRKKT